MKQDNKNIEAGTQEIINLTDYNDCCDVCQCGDHTRGIKLHCSCHRKQLRKILNRIKQQEQERIVEVLEKIDEEKLMSEEDIKLDKEIFGAVENSKHLTSAKWGYKKGINQAIKIIKNNE